MTDNIDPRALAEALHTRAAALSEVFEPPWWRYRARHIWKTRLQPDHLVQMQLASLLGEHEPQRSFGVALDQVGFRPHWLVAWRRIWRR